MTVFRSNYSPRGASQEALVEGSIPGPGRSPGGGNGNSLQYSCLENPIDGKPGGLPSMGRTESDTNSFRE